MRMRMGLVRMTMVAMVAMVAIAGMVMSIAV
jgi:hypothetical protein